MKKYALIFIIFTVLCNHVSAEIEETYTTKEHRNGMGLLAGGPAVLGLDFEYKKMYGFVSVSALHPIKYSEFKWWAFSGGTGPTFNINAKWNFDLLLLALFDFHKCQTTVWDASEKTYREEIAYKEGLGGGLGVGFHYTHPSGLTFGVKIPVIGLMSQFGNCWWYGENYPPFTFLRFIRNYGLSAPWISIGFRF